MDTSFALVCLHSAGFSQRSLLMLLLRGVDAVEIVSHPTLTRLVSFGITKERAPEVLANLRELDVAHLQKTLASRKVKIVIFGTPEYPPLLAQLPYAPALLYVRGNLHQDRTYIAVVGSRAPSAEGRAHTHIVTKDLAQAGLVIVSGGAYGIDSLAHEAALQAGAPTVCITGTGMDVDYPPRHTHLFERIVESGGAVVSVFPIGTPGLPYHFPARNEVVVGLSRGVVIAEAREKSGTLITARLALDLCRDVFVVPGDMARESCRGSNRLLCDGHAQCILGAHDILVEWDLARAVESTSESGGPSDISLLPTYRAVRDKPMDADSLTSALGLPSGDLAGILARLEAGGWV